MTKLPLLALGLAAISAGVALAVHLNRAARVDTEPGQARSAFVVAAGERATLVLIDHVRANAEKSADRIAAVDAATGHLVAERLEDEALDCWPARGPRAWCATASGISLIEIPSLELIARVAPLVTASGRPAPAIGQFARRGPDLLMRLADESRVLIDSASLAVSDAAPTMVAGSDRDTISCEAKGPPGGSRAGPFSVQGSAVRFADAAGHLVWTATLPTPSCTTAVLAGPRLLIATSDPAHRAYALDAAHGTLLWSFAF